MKVTIQGSSAPFTVEAHPFDIEGSGEEFIVHETKRSDTKIGYEDFTATHVGTGHRVAHAETMQKCIDEARRIWWGKTPDELEAAIKSAKMKKEFYLREN